MAFKKISSFYCFIRPVSHLRYLYRFYHSRATRTWSVCNENVSQCVQIWIFNISSTDSFTQKYIFDTNIIQSEYAFLFPFSIYINVLNRNFDALIRVPTRDRMNWKKILLYYGNIANGIHATNIHDTNAIQAAIFTDYSTDTLWVFDQSDILYNISMLRFWCDQLLSLKLVRTPLNVLLRGSMHLYTSGERHAWFHLHGTSRPVRSASKATKYKMKNSCPQWDSNPQPSV